jgi:predicted alpha/beta superfamily hydrolase
MRYLAALAAIASLLTACSPPREAEATAVASVGAEAPEARAYEMPDSEVLTIASPALGRTYEVFVRLPPGHGDAENAGRRYPVLYLNDAHYVFQTAAGVTLAPMRHGGLEPMILVGVSYAVGEGGSASRGRDLTPTRNPEQTAHATGEARAFLTFMRDEVVPLVERSYPVDPSRRVFAGQSYGGLFGAYALLEEPGLFSDYILTSPSLWYGKGAMFDIEEAAAKAGKPLKGRVFFAIGETETPAISGGGYDMVGDQKRFAETLRSRGYQELTVRDTVIESGTHLTTFPIGLLHGLMWLAPGPKPYGG